MSPPAVLAVQTEFTKKCGEKVKKNLQYAYKYLDQSPSAVTHNAFSAFTYHVKSQLNAGRTIFDSILYEMQRYETKADESIFVQGL